MPVFHSMLRFSKYDLHQYISTIFEIEFFFTKFDKIHFI
jgi:hypothetical protein